TGVTQTSASITTFRWVRRFAASSEKLFMTRSPTKTFPVISRGELAEGSAVGTCAGDHPRAGVLTPTGLLFPIPPISHHHSPALPERNLFLRPSQTCGPI